MRQAYQNADRQGQVRSWKLFKLTSRMLLWRSHQRNPKKHELEKRLERFHNQEWATLIQESREAGARPRKSACTRPETTSLGTKARRAEQCVRQGEVSRGRQALCANSLAPGTPDTLRELTDPEKRPPVLSESIPPEILSFWPAASFELSREKYAKNIRSAPRGSAAGLAGDTNEHYKVVLDDEEATELLLDAAEKLAQADVPEAVSNAMSLGSLTALRKDDGKVRGIVAGDTFRRGVSRTMAQQSAQVLEKACSPFQFALSTRAGTDCVARLIKALIELDPSKTVTSIDGIGAYDHIKRKAMLGALYERTELQQLIPFVRMFYGKDSEYIWYDDKGEPHSIRQGEGGEQGDPLMPALFALGQHAALVEVNEKLQDGEFIFAFLDDIYVVSQPDRVHDIFQLVALALERHAGVQVHLGKTKIWNAARRKPPGSEAIHKDAWVGGKAERSQRGRRPRDPSGNPSFY